MVETPRKFPWPDKPQDSPLGILTDVRRIDDFATDFFRGTWVTSFSGWMLFNPLPKQKPTESNAAFTQRLADLPPLFGGYGWSATPVPEGTYKLREGYFPVAMLLRLKLDGLGGITGVNEVVRGGSIPKPGSPPTTPGFIKMKLTGSYGLALDPDLPGVPIGSIVVRHDNLGGFPIEWNYSFVIKNINELEWLFKTSNERPMVAQGTLSRMH